MENLVKVALIGFGEAGQAIVRGWHQSGVKQRLEVCAFDIKSNQPEHKVALESAYREAHVRGFDNAVGACHGAAIIFSLVTADEALNAAKSVIPGLAINALYFDANSCAPETKREADRLFEQANCNYIDVAIMSPIFQKLHRSPLLISGKNQTKALKILGQLDMRAKSTDGPVGDASATKMIRSIMIKGMEALSAECVIAGQKAGVNQRVLDSLEKSFPGFNWPERAAYNLERMMVHGKRRAAEMREVAKTLDQLGIDNSMTRSIVDWQDRIGGLALDPDENNYKSRASRILSALDKSNSSDTDLE